MKLISSINRRRKPIAAQSPPPQAGIPTRAQRAGSEVARILSPEGAAVDSLGRKPQENGMKTIPSPEGATLDGDFTFVPPLRGSRFSVGPNTWGLRPRLSPVTASRLNRVISKRTGARPPGLPRSRAGRTLNSAPPRRGFTLIELLVVVSILVIVTTITVMTVNFSMSSERIRSSARQIQSYLEGARDRAIYAKEPRGVRILVDQTIPGTASSLVFIGPSEPWTDGLVRLERRDADNNGVADNPNITVLRGDGTNTQWSTLKDRKLLFDGLRVKIPRGKDGSWYTVDTSGLSSSPPSNPSRNEVLYLSTPYRDPGSSLSTTHVIAFEGGGPSTYSLALPPSILPNQEPVLLPRGIVIDLDGSKIPKSWRLGGGSYSARMDLMFSPRGTVIGAPVSQGLIHFYLAEQVDVERANNVLAARPLAANVAQPVVPADEIGSPAEPIGDRLIVTLFTQTGAISTHPVRGTDAGSDGKADDPYRYAELGEVAGQ